MTKATGEGPRLWGSSIVGVVYGPGSGGRVGHAPRPGFSPRKAASSVYLFDGIEQHAAELRGC